MIALSKRLDALNMALKDQTKIVNKRKRSVALAKEKLAIERDKYDSLLYKRDTALVESWGNSPDWRVLLENSDDYSRLIYELGNAAIESIGLSFNGINVYTNQRGVCISFESNSFSELVRAKNGIELIAPHVRPNDSGIKNISVSHSNTADYALRLDFINILENVFLVKTEWSQEVERKEFSKLIDALQHIQRYVSDLDYLEPAKDAIESF